jgi:hypothetical protein
VLTVMGGVAPLPEALEEACEAGLVRLWGGIAGDGGPGVSGASGGGDDGGVCGFLNLDGDKFDALARDIGAVGDGATDLV